MCTVYSLRTRSKEYWYTHTIRDMRYTIHVIRVELFVDLRLFSMYGLAICTDSYSFRVASVCALWLCSTLPSLYLQSLSCSFMAFLSHSPSQSSSFWSGSELVLWRHVSMGVWRFTLIHAPFFLRVFRLFTLSYLSSYSAILNADTQWRHQPKIFADIWYGYAPWTLSTLHSCQLDRETSVPLCKHHNHFSIRYEIVSNYILRSEFHDIDLIATAHVIISKCEWRWSGVPLTYHEMSSVWRSGDERIHSTTANIVYFDNSSRIHTQWRFGHVKPAIVICK